MVANVDQIVLERLVVKNVIPSHFWDEGLLWCAQIFAHKDNWVKVLILSVTA